MNAQFLDQEKLLQNKLAIRKEMYIPIFKLQILHIRQRPMVLKSSGPLIVSKEDRIEGKMQLRPNLPNSYS